jgi:hydroxymethylpyrimidine/phosphomethylpyrimidine kinase
VLVAAGLDPSGGAGLLADLQALAAVGARGYAVATALTVQSDRGDTRAPRSRPPEPSARAGGRPSARILVTPPDHLRAQIDALVLGPAAARIAAVKTGMVGSAALARALAARLAEPPLARTPLVVDPVLAATSGASLLEAGGLTPGEALAPLLARARLVTPNLPELALLAGRAVEDDEAAIRAARSLGARGVLVKGGHRAGAPVDLLVVGRRVVRLTGRRRPGTARGTGCRLASAIAGLLARGASLEEAVRGAKRVVERYLDQAGER